MNKAEDAANAAVSSPLLETSISGARGVIINITSSPDIGLDDVERAATLITNSAHPDANIIWGAAFDESMKDEMCITVIATGFEAGAGEAEAVPAAAVAGHEAAQQYAFTSEKAPVQQAQPVAQPQPEPVAAPAPVAPAPEPEDAFNLDDILTVLNNRH